MLDRTCRNGLDLMVEHVICSIAFPVISTGRFSYPKKAAAEIAVRSVRQWKREHPNNLIKVISADVDLTIYRYFCEALKGPEENPC